MSDPGKHQVQPHPPSCSPEVLQRAAERVDGIASRLSHRVSFASRAHADAISLILSDLAKYRLEFINQSRTRLAKRSAWADKHCEEVLAGEKALLASVRAIDSGILDAGELFHDVKGVLGLLEVCELPRQCGVICSDPVAVADVFSAVLASSWIQSSIDSSRSVLSGPGISWCMPGHTPVALDHNAVALHCCDDRGEAVRGLSAEYFDVYITLVGDETVKGMVEGLTVQDGVLSFQYSLEPPATEGVNAHASITIDFVGVAVKQCTIPVGGTIDGRPSVAFPLVTKEKHIGLAVNKDCSRMAVGCTSTSRIYVYSLPTGVFVSEFQSTSDHKGPVSDTPPFKMCFMPNDNLLFAQKYAGRLVECTLTGDFVREFAPPVDDRRHRSSQFWSVAVNDSVVVAGVWGSGPQIYVFDVGTGALLRGFGQEGSEIGKLKSCIGLRITPDNSHVLIAEYFSNRVSLWTLDGQYVRSFTSGVSGPHDIEFASNGDIIVAEYGGKCVSVHSSDGSMMLRRFNNAGSKFKDAIALAMWGRRLLVLEGESDKLCSFE